jgi:hypothetical protein
LLIDEYDAPVSYNLDKLDVAEANQKILSEFYSQLKSLTDDLRFLFVTGVSNYSFIWRSGSLNHLDDLTLDPRYSGVCGFTHDEMDACFKEFFPITLKILQSEKIMGKDDSVADLRRRILDWYGGYSWDGISKVLNPYALLKFFSKNKFANYWTKLEPPKKFINTFVFKDPLAFHRGALPSLREETISVTEADSLEPAPVLFQTGYLTVDTIISAVDKLDEYRLKVPNEEVKNKFNSAFASFLFKKIKKDPEAEKLIFQEALLSKDAETISNLITANFSALPAARHSPSESRYHGLLFFYFLGMPNVETLCEPAGAEGTPDLVVKFNDGIYAVIELKYKKNEKSNARNDPNEDKIDKIMKRLTESGVSQQTADVIINELAKITNKSGEKELEEGEILFNAKHSGKKNNANLTKNEIKIITEGLAKKGLKAIETLNYAAPYLIDAKKIFKIGLGIYGRGYSQALFGK